MNFVIELDTDRLVDISAQLWSQYANTKLDFYQGTATIDCVTLNDNMLAEVKSQIPWVSGNVGFIVFEPGSTCPIHTDLHDDGYYKRSFNVLIESDGDDHTTRYYKYLPGNYDASTEGNLFKGDMSNLELIFEFTLRKPSIFFNQIFHDVFNSGSKRRVTALWLIDPEVTDEEIAKWCADNQIPNKVIFDGIY